MQRISYSPLHSSKNERVMKRRSNRPAIIGLIVLLLVVALIAGFLLTVNQIGQQQAQTHMPSVLTEIYLTVVATLNP